VLRVQFLDVGAPLHSSYLTNAVDQSLNGDINDEELRTMDELRGSVYHTNDGAEPPLHLQKYTNKISGSDIGTSATSAL
jgi:hypothetical protein